MKPVIRLEHIEKVFHDGKDDFEALRDVSLDVEEGDIFGIIGLSGAGKSTLVRCLNLLERPTSGKVFLHGQDMTALSPAEIRRCRQKIGMVFQHFNLYPHLSVVKNLEIAPRLVKGRKGPDLRAQAMELLGVSRTTAYNRLKQMVQRGKLTQIGTRYYLFGQVVPPERQPQVILEYLTREGFAYRQDIAQLLHVDPRQCRPILRRMVENGQIVQEKQRYTLKQA